MQPRSDEWRHGRTGFDGWDESVGRGAGELGAAARRRPRPTWRSARRCRRSSASSRPRSSRARGCSCARGGLHVGAVPVARPGGARRAGAARRRSSELAEAVDGGTDLVAVSAVQSSDGRLADLDAIAAAAAHHGARTLVDATQACGWLPLDASRFDYVVCAGYKWLLGAARDGVLLRARAEARERLAPHLAGWYAADRADGATSTAGRCGWRTDAKAFDVSPAWLSWVGQAPALELLERGRRSSASTRTTRAGRALPGGPRAGARRLGDRLARPARGGRRPAGGGARALRGPRRADALLVPPRQHRGGRRPRARGAAASRRGTAAARCRGASGATPYS